MFAGLTNELVKYWISCSVEKHILMQSQGSHKADTRQSQGGHKADTRQTQGRHKADTENTVSTT